MPRLSKQAKKSLIVYAKAIKNSNKPYCRMDLVPNNEVYGKVMQELIVKRCVTLAMFTGIVYVYPSSMKYVEKLGN